MVGVLIRLRLRLLAGSLHGGAGVLMLVGTLIGLLYAGLSVVSILLVSHQAGVAAAIDVTALIYTVWTLGWVCGPVLFGGGDETLQPEHLRLLPLSHRQLARGLLAVAFVGPAPVINLIVFAGLIVVGASAGIGATVVAAVGAVSQLVFVIVLSRVMLAGIGAMMRTRRGKDLGVVAAAFAGLAGYPISMLMNRIGEIRQGFPAQPAVALRIVPSGWAPYAVESAACGAWGLSLLALAGLAGLILLLWQAWAVLLRRRLTAPDTASGSVRTEGVAGGLVARLAPANPVGAVVLRELRTWWRDSRRRAVLIPAVLVGSVMPAFPAFQGSGTAGVPFAGLTVVWFAMSSSVNLYGFDGAALWQTLVTPHAARADVIGRMTAWLLVIAPIALLVTVVAPLLVGRSAMYPWALGLLPVILGSGAAVMIVLSVYAPYPVPAQRGNPFVSSGNPGCAKGMLSLVGTLAQAVLALPVLAVLWFGAHQHSSLIRWLALPVSFAIAGGVVTVAARIAQRRIDTHGPELLAAVQPR